MTEPRTEKTPYDPLEGALPRDNDERKLFKSQMMGFVLLPVGAMALLGVLIVLLEVF